MPRAAKVTIAAAVAPTHRFMDPSRKTNGYIAVLVRHVIKQFSASIQKCTITLSLLSINQILSTIGIHLAII
jgi:hypothetical protein